MQGLLFLYPVKPISRGRKWQQERRNCCSIPYEISPFLKFRFIQSVPGSLWVLPPVLPFRVHSHSALILNYTLENRQCPGSKKENCWVVVPEMCPPPWKNCWHHLHLSTYMALINPNTWLGKNTWMRRNNSGGIQIARLYKQIMKRFPGKQNTWVWIPLLLSLPFLSLCLHLRLQREASCGEITHEQLLTQRELFFRPCSTLRAVDYEILWSILSPQASVNISWHMGERNPHSLRARLPPAKRSSTTPLHCKRDNKARRCQTEQLS